MQKMITINKVKFMVRTQALLNFTPMTFLIKNKTIKPNELTQVKYWNEETYRILGKNFITFVDKENTLWEIKINKFPQSYEKLKLSLEASPQLVPGQFNVLEAGLVNIGFSGVLDWAYGKFVVPKKMSER